MRDVQLRYSRSTAYVGPPFFSFRGNTCSLLDTETKKYSTETCHVPGRDRRDLVRIVAIVFGILGLVAYALRCFARFYITAQQWGTSDWVITAAVVVMIPLQVLSIPCMLSLEPLLETHRSARANDRDSGQPWTWTRHVERPDGRRHVHSLPILLG
jgi:hypothetical protein